MLVLHLEFILIPIPRPKCTVWMEQTYNTVDPKKKLWCLWGWTWKALEFWRVCFHIVPGFRCFGRDQSIKTCKTWDSKWISPIIGHLIYVGRSRSLQNHFDLPSPVASMASPARFGTPMGPAITAPAWQGWSAQTWMFEIPAYSKIA